MRIYEGSPRQDWEEVLRSIGAYVDDRGMRGIVVLESDTGLIVQGTTASTAAGSTWGESMGQVRRETLMLDDEQIGKFMDDGLSRRGSGAERNPTHYEAQLRVIGRFFDEKKPRDVLFFELDGAYVARLTQTGQTGLRQEVVEFTPEDIAELIANAPSLRRPEPPANPVDPGGPK